MTPDWRTMLHGWPYPAVVVDQASVVMERNAAADRLFGTSLGVGSQLREAVTYLESGQPGIADVVEVKGSGAAMRLEMTIAAFGPGGIVEFRPLGRTFVLDHRTRALVDAGLALTRETHQDGLLQRLVDVARPLTNAQYAALGVLDSTGTRLARFITSGMSSEALARMGAPPTGKGVLGHLIRHPEAIRLPDLRNHPASAGFPPNHPPMSSFLGVPVRTHERVFGNLYVTNKIDAPEFSATDQALLEALAAQAAVSITNAQLREARENFVAHVTHEIGNQLTAVRLAAELLLDDVETPDAKMSVEQIITSSEESRRLMGDLMSLVRIEQGELELTLQAYPVGSMLEDIVFQMRERAERAGKQIALGEVGDGQVLVQVDAGRLRQILLNLLSNAIKYGGKAVEAGARPVGAAQVEVWVSDRGPGIPHEEQERIFEPWVRLHEGEGSGIGLAVSRQLARLMGGDLIVDSAPGEGSRFRLLLRRSIDSGSERVVHR